MNNDLKHKLERETEQLSLDVSRLESENHSLRETVEVQKTKILKLGEDWEQSLYEMERKDHTIRGLEDDSHKLKNKYMHNEHEYGVT